MWFIKLILLISFIIYSTGIDICSICGKYSNIKTKVFNGHKSKYGPWVVFLKIKHKNNDNKINLCSGSIIDLQHIMTSAHCFSSNLGLSRDQDPKPEVLAKFVEINAGSLKKNDKLFIKLQAKAVFIHELFTTRNLSDPNTNTWDDIAIIKLNRKIKISNNLRPICLGINPKEKTKATVQGYGITNCVNRKNDDPKIQSTDLMETDMFIQADKVCERAYNQNNRWYLEEHLCVDSKDGSTTCGGDSGGVLKSDEQINNEKIAFQIGITSFGGPGDGQPNKPTVFTRVYSYLPWIHKITGVSPCFIEEKILMIYENFY